MEAQNFQPSTPDLTTDPIVQAPGRGIRRLYTHQAPTKAPVGLVTISKSIGARTVCGIGK